MRKTSNVIWVISWIEAIPLHGLGRFDLASCTGVLHHLKSPQKGLNVIKDTQTSDGGANLMVYGKYGRTGIYHLQDLFKIINKDENNISKEISNAKVALDALPENPWSQKPNIPNNNKGDVEIYDLLLHKRDVAYSISSLFEWVQKSNYRSIHFALAKSRAGLTFDVLIPEHHLQNIVEKLDIDDQYLILDIITGHIDRHEIYISLNENSDADLYANGMTIYAHGSNIRFQDMFSDNRFHHTMDNHTYIYRGLIQTHIEESGSTSRSTYKTKESISDFILPVTKLSQFVMGRLRELLTKPKLVFELLKEFKSQTKYEGTNEHLKNEFQKIYSHLSRTGMFYLKHKSVGLFPKTCCFDKFKVFGVKR